jgi:8-oxo-dGTP pyrophosphatase MutT (NUDIX family)
LALDDGPDMPLSSAAMLEVSAGAVLVDARIGEPRVLVVRLRKEGYEIPKGHVEPGETDELAALRELREETGLASNVLLGPDLGAIEYSFEGVTVPVRKRVHYFAAFLADGKPVEFAALPKRTKELNWITSSDLPALPLVNEELRSILALALSAKTKASEVSL